MAITEQQRRALWSVAFTELAAAINTRCAQPPTSLDLWTQYVSPEELLDYADNSCTRPLPIRINPKVATLTVPTGELLGIDVKWTIQADLARLDEFTRAVHVARMEEHNRECVEGQDAAPQAES